MADMTANMVAANVDVRRAIVRRTDDPAGRKRMLTALKSDRWAGDPFLARQMRKHWRRGKNRTHDQIVVRADQHHPVADGGGRLWLAVPGLERRRMVRIPLSTTVAPTGTLRLIVRGGRVEVHYQIDASMLRSSRRPCGDGMIGVDKGYTEALTDSDGEQHGVRLGKLLAAGDPDIALHTPHHRVKQILQDRTDRHRTRLPVQDASPTNLGRRAKHPNRSATSH